MTVAPSATPTPTLEPGKGGGVPSSWKGIPIMPEATNYEEIEDGVTYTVTASLSDVDSFYSTQMEDLGWTFLYRDDSTEGYLMLIYQKGSVNAGIGAIEDGDQCLVILGVS
jgi:hypothetical protein